MYKPSAASNAGPLLVFTVDVVSVRDVIPYDAAPDVHGMLTAMRSLIPAFTPAVLAALMLCPTGNVLGAEAADTATWRAVASGAAVVLMRHALAPGVGDPDAFELDDCTTQRNLSAAGRTQARALGRALIERIGEPAMQVYSSAWCRCLETGRLLGVGEVVPLPALNSFFRRRGAAEGQTRDLRVWIDARVVADNEPPAILVTHQVNVTAVTGVYPASGEAVIVAAGGKVMLRVLLADP